MKTLVVIPARYDSVRFPGKPLADLLGKPMIQHVVERASLATCADGVVVATDDMRIYDAVLAFGGQAVMTSKDHPSGTDRVVEVSRAMAADVYINVQGDEPLIRPADIDRIAMALAMGSPFEVATLSHAISPAEAHNPNVVKVVTAHDGRALYFSRLPIPFARDGDRLPPYHKHIGIYGFKRSLLARYEQLAPSDLELCEKLEQLRLLQAGVAIQVLETEPTGPGVDTPACLERVKRWFEGETASAAALDRLKLLLLDVDGVLTTGHLWYSAEGEALKPFHARDGLGLSMLERAGVRVGVVSGRSSPALLRRLGDLGIDLYELGENDKRTACERLMARAGVTSGETAFIGDDSLDLPAFQSCGISFAVGDAPSYVRARATYTLATPGGHGAVREATDLIMIAKGLSPADVSLDEFQTQARSLVQ